MLTQYDLYNSNINRRVCTSKAASDSSSEACNSSLSISVFFFAFWSSWTLLPPSES